MYILTLFLIAEFLPISSGQFFKLYSSTTDQAIITQASVLLFYIFHFSPLFTGYKYNLPRWCNGLFGMTFGITAGIWNYKYNQPGCKNIGFFFFGNFFFNQCDLKHINRDWRDGEAVRHIYWFPALI